MIRRLHFLVVSCNKGNLYKDNSKGSVPEEQRCESSRGGCGERPASH
jgi:hypothetical protein